MYKKVVGKKRNSSIAGMAVILVFCICIFMFTGSVGKIISVLVFCLFGGLMYMSIAKYNRGLRQIESKYPGNLEADINNCKNFVANKYFFLNDCLVDLENVKIINYKSIKSAEGARTGNHMSANGGLSAGFAVELHMTDGAVVLIANFRDGTDAKPSEMRRNYDSFLSQLSAKCPDLNITDKLLKSRP